MMSNEEIADKITDYLLDFISLTTIDTTEINNLCLNLFNLGLTENDPTLTHLLNHYQLIETTIILGTLKGIVKNNNVINKVHINKRYIDKTDYIHNTKFTFVCSTQETGKSFQLSHITKYDNKLSELENTDAYTIVYITHRRILTQEASSLLNIDYYEDLKNKRKAKTHDTHVATTIQSLHHFNPSNMKNILIVVDEPTQMLMDIISMFEDTEDLSLGDKITKDHITNSKYTSLVNFFSAAKKVILLDADYSKADAEFWMSFDKGSPDMTLVYNDYQLNKKVTNHVALASVKGSMLERLDKGEHIAIATSNRDGSQGVDVLLEFLQTESKTNINYLIVAGDGYYKTKSKEGNDVSVMRSLLHDITKYNVFIYTSAIFTGVSIKKNDHRVSACYSLFYSHTNFKAADVVQSLQRCRGVGEYECYNIIDDIPEGTRKSNIIGKQHKTFIKSNPKYINNKFLNTSFALRQARTVDAHRLNGALEGIVDIKSWSYEKEWRWSKTKKKGQTKKQYNNGKPPRWGASEERVNLNIIKQLKLLIIDMINNNMIKKEFPPKFLVNGKLDMKQYNLGSIEEQMSYLISVYGSTKTIQAKGEIKKLEIYEEAITYYDYSYDQCKRHGRQWDVTKYAFIKKYPTIGDLLVPNSITKNDNLQTPTKFRKVIAKDLEKYSVVIKTVGDLFEFLKELRGDLLMTKMTANESKMYNILRKN